MSNPSARGSYAMNGGKETARDTAVEMSVGSLATSKQELNSDNNVTVKKGKLFSKSL